MSCGVGVHTVEAAPQEGTARLLKFLGVWLDNEGTRCTPKSILLPLCSHKTCTRQSSDIKPRDTCNYRGSLCYRLPRGKTAGKSLRACKPRFYSREIPMTAREPVLAGFCESGLEVVVDGRGRPNTEKEVKGSTCPPVVLLRRRSPRRVGERRLASLHSALRLCCCLGRHPPFPLDPIRLHLCSLSSRDVGLQGGRCTEGGGRRSWPPSARPPPPGGPSPPVGC
ncbi:uncharacterized protein LOC130844367 [Hippopotamus amphibius kiboko]|uniref:uncharacterized protein LOC130844367 n=1 Tax=Hippopotamus amphibius kiboko TaxID=575201 RepID=UPI002593DD2E|nr:uncharacterized protein LOC130844367 [Hippopotamus amphibius kiboko]